MRKKIICFVLVFLSLAPNVVFATNWVYVERYSDPIDRRVQIFGTPFTEFVDADNVYKDGNSLFFWEKEVYDKLMRSTKIRFVKWEVNQSNQNYRVVEYQDLDSSNHEIITNNAPSEWGKILSREPINNRIEIALKYVKKGKDPGMKPTP